MVGLAVQLILSLAMLVVGLWAQSPALTAATWHLFGGMPIWIILLLIYNQHRLERIEALETEQLARTDTEAAAIFDEHGIDLQLARRRLDRLYSWGLNAVSVLVAIYLLAIGLWRFLANYQALYGDAPTGSAIGDRARGGVLVCVAVAVAMTAFLVARYVSGMTRVREWQLLRGGAAYLMGNAAVAVLVIVASGVMVLFDGSDAVFKPLALAVPAIMALIGFECSVAFLLGAYRPRRPGEVPRPAFDSRVLGFLTSPESIGRIISETISYQFGFEISRSWFYRLLGKAITPMIAFGLFMLVLISSAVVVGPHEQAIITRFGRIVPYDEPAGRVAFGPGLHLKLPWPISRAEKYAVGRIHQVSVGSITTKLKPGVAILWTNPHTEGPEQYLVTAPAPLRYGREAGAADDNSADASTPGMSLVAAEVITQYRVSELGKYVNSAQDPEAMLTALADRCVSAYFVAQNIDALLTRGRLDAGDALKQQIQAAADAMGLGIEIVFVGITGIHPPQQSEVAAAFQEQIGALQERQSMIERAQQTAIETLAAVAGSRDQALATRNAIARLDQLKVELERRRAAGDEPEALAQLTRQIDEQTAEVERLLMAAQGEAAIAIYDARAYRWKIAITERAQAERFKSELLAYDRAPDYYRSRQYLNTLAEGLKDARKIIVNTDDERPIVIRLDLTDAASSLEFLEGQ